MRIRQTVNVAHIEATRKIYEISFRRPEGENPLR
jgi:hypothetical protein